MDSWLLDKNCLPPFPLSCYRRFSCQFASLVRSSRQPDQRLLQQFLPPLLINKSRRIHDRKNSDRVYWYFLSGIHDRTDRHAGLGHGPFGDWLFVDGHGLHGRTYFRHHYNPAVTLALTLREFPRLPISFLTGSPRSWVPWQRRQSSAWSFRSRIQLLDFSAGPGEGYTLASAGPWIVEILFTFLRFALSSSTLPASVGTKGNSFYGLAIGFTIVAAAFAGGAISGGAFNPAVGIGPNVIKATMGGEPSALANLGLHVGGPLIGGVLAACVFYVQETHVEKQGK